MLKELLAIFKDLNCSKVLIKRLSPNDNSKNQVYFGGSFDILNVLPIADIKADSSGDWKRSRYKSTLNFFWVNREGEIDPAADAQLILYPKYPEVRFSGFLKGTKGWYSDLMTERLDGRLLFLGIGRDGRIFGYVCAPSDSIIADLTGRFKAEVAGVFWTLPVLFDDTSSNKTQLLRELKRIHDSGWIASKRLNGAGDVLPCVSSNCGGLTLEAELGVRPNGYAAPDYLGWEVKQFSVTKFSSLASATVTLMTPEPTDGYYVSNGVEAFIRRFGYQDKMGRENRMNFGGIHKFENITKSTGLTLKLLGFDHETNKIKDVDGCLALLDANETIAASWSFASLIKHWNTKHSQACYVPSMRRRITAHPSSEYFFGDHVLMGEFTDFILVLRQIVAGNIYYDPGIKLEMAIEGEREKSIKRRSQFRIRSKHLSELYKQSELVDLKSLNFH